MRKGPPSPTIVLTLALLTLGSCDVSRPPRMGSDGPDHAENTVAGWMDIADVVLVARLREPGPTRVTTDTGAGLLVPFLVERVIKASSKAVITAGTEWNLYQGDQGAPRGSRFSGADVGQTFLLTATPHRFKLDGAETDALLPFIRACYQRVEERGVTWGVRMLTQEADRQEIRSGLEAGRALAKADAMRWRELLATAQDPSGSNLARATA